MGCIGLTSEPKKKEMRLILLGIAGSGKTTFSKQMQIIHNGGFEPSQTELYKRILISNVLFGMKQLVDIGMEEVAAEHRKKARYLQTVDEVNVEMDDEIAERVKVVWADEAIQSAWQNRKESILVQLEYLMANFDRFIAPDFIPTNDDILRARQRSTGENFYRFEDKDRIWNLIDVGGQLSERTKWGSVLENPIQAMLFFLALDEYDIANPETNSSGTANTKFDLALSIFEEVIQSEVVAEHKPSRIVFLNKLDLFTLKIQDERRFDDFKERLHYNGEKNVDSCISFISEKLRLCIHDELPLHIHPVCALDTSLMKKLTQDIKISIVTSSLKDMGIL